MNEAERQQLHAAFNREIARIDAKIFDLEAMICGLRNDRQMLQQELRHDLEVLDMAESEVGLWKQD